MKNKNILLKALLIICLLVVMIGIPTCFIWDTLWYERHYKSIYIPTTDETFYVICKHYWFDDSYVFELSKTKYCNYMDKMKEKYHRNSNTPISIYYKVSNDTLYIGNMWTSEDSVNLNCRAVIIQPTPHIKRTTGIVASFAIPECKWLNDGYMKFPEQ